jgi:hypothetical protein
MFDSCLEMVPLCPLCRAEIYWILHSGVEGATNIAYCANNGSSTRVIVDPANMVSCKWEGIVRRNENGAVDIYNVDGSTVPHRVVKRHVR